MNLLSLQIGIVLFCAGGAALELVLALPARVDRMVERIARWLTKSGPASDPLAR